MKKQFIAMAFLLFFTLIAHAQVGTIDASFGNSGGYTFPILSGINTVEAQNMVVLPNDQIVIATNEQYGNFLTKGKLNKLTANGLVDASFGSGGSIQVIDSAYSFSNIIVMPNGNFLASWHKNRPNITITDDYPFMTMHNANGSFVNSFGVNGRVDLPSSPTGGTIGSELAADAANNIYVKYDYNNNQVIRSYTSTGAINTTFGNGGLVVFNNNDVLKMVYTPTSGGRLLLLSYDSNDNLIVTRYLLNGLADFTFGSAGIVQIPATLPNSDGAEILAMALQNDGKILFQVVETSTTQALSKVVRINANGSFDTAFNNNAQIGTIPMTGQIFAANKLIEQPDGKILLGGGVFDLNTDNIQKAFFRLNADGSFDTTFGNNGLVALGIFNGEYVVDVKLQSTGKIIGLINNDNSTAAYIIRLLNTLTIGVLENVAMQQLLVYPNPVQNNFELSYELTQPQIVSINLIDAQGRTVHYFQKNETENGTQTHNFVLPATIASGNYIVSIQSGKSTNNVQIIVR